MAVERKQIYDFDILPTGSLATPDDLWFLVDDDTVGGPTVPTYRVSASSIANLALTKLTAIITAPAHGFISSDEKRPLHWNGSTVAIYDDTSATQYPLLWLDEVVDVNTLSVVISGIVTFADTLLEVGWNIVTDGPLVYWDDSLDVYVATIPGDSASVAREVLAVLSVSGGIVTAIKLTWGPLT